MCDTCNQKMEAANADQGKILKEAVELAKQTGQLVGIYTDENGKEQLILASAGAGYPIKRHISPYYRDPQVQ